MKLYQLRRTLQDGDVLDAGDVAETDRVFLLSREVTEIGLVEKCTNTRGKVATIISPFHDRKELGALRRLFANMINMLSRITGLF